MMTVVEAPAAEIPPVSISDVVFLLFTDFLSAGFTPHVFVPPS